MKVLVVVDSVWPPVVKMTGTSFIYNLQKCLHRKGIDIHILTSIEKWADPQWRMWFKNEKKREGIQFHYINSILKVLPKLYFFLSKILYFFVVLKLNSRYKFDVIHEYSSSPILFNRTAMYHRLLKVKTIHTLCTYSAGFLGSFVFLRKKTNLSKIVCSTNHLRNKLLQRGVPKSKIVYLPTAVNTKRFTSNLDVNPLKEDLNIPQKSRVILYIGLIEERKGIFTLLESVPLVLKKNPNSVFIIVTGISKGTFYNYERNRDKVIKLIKKNQEKIRLLEGWQNIPLLMSMADVFVLPLTTLSGILGYPLTLLEAMASGKAIVASDIVGVNEVISDGETGLLFQKGNSHELAKSINKLLQNAELRKKLGENAKNYVKRYDLDIISRKLKEVYVEICSESYLNGS